MKVFLSALVATTTLDAVGAALLGEGAFGDKYYKAYDNTVATWDVANGIALAATFDCRNRKGVVNGKLAEPKSEAENVYIASLIPDASSARPWLGVIDKVTEGAFTYASSGAPIVYSAWYPGEPNDWNNGNPGEDCAHYGFYDQDKNWNDWFCTQPNPGYVIEFDCTRPWAGRDPHIKTWSGEMYDFHGACDLVLLQNDAYDNGRGMDIHIRTKFTRSWSYIANAVLRLGENTFEVQGGTEHKYWLNGVEGADLAEGLDGHSITYNQESSKKTVFVVDLGNDEAIEMMIWKEFVNVNMISHTKDTFGSSLGLLGRYGSGRKMARDGVTVISDNNEFGFEWQVLPEEPMLFHNIEGVQAPEKCAMPDATKARRRLRESTISIDDAELACARVTAGVDRDACIFDVLATNDKEAAGAY